MATVWEQIQEKRKGVEELQVNYGQTKAKFMEDGVVTPNEQSMLNKIETGLAAAKAKVKALEDEFKANKAKWEGRRSKEYVPLCKQFDELVDWGDPACEGLKVIINDAGKHAFNQAYVDAMNTLDRGLAFIKGPYEEYKKQLPKKKTYDSTHDGIQDRGADKRKIKFAQKDTVAKQLDSFDATLKMAEESAESRQYIDACRHLEAAEATVDAVEKEIEALAAKQEQCLAEFASVKGDMALYGTSRFKTVQEMNAGMERANTAIGELLAAFDYDKALAEIKIARQHVNELKAEHERLEKEEAEWDSKQPAVDEAKKKAEEVKEYGGEGGGGGGAADVGMKLDEAGKKASEEEYKKAAETAEEGKKKVDEAYKKVEEQKKAQSEYEPKRKDFDARLGKIDIADVATPDIESLFMSLQKAAIEMDGLAMSKDFVGALKRIDPELKQLASLETKVAEEKKKKEEAAKLLEEAKKKASECGETSFKSIKDAVKAVADKLVSAEKEFEQKKFDAVKNTAQELVSKAVEVAKEIAKLIEKQQQWEQKKPDLTAVEEQIKQLLEWGIKEAGAVKQTAEDALKKAADEAFEDAVNAAEEAKKAVAPLIEKLDKEKRAEVIYRGLKAAYDAQMEVYRQSRFAAEQAVKLILDQAKKVTDPIENLVSEKQFEKATEEIKKATEKLTEVAKEVTRLEDIEKQIKDTLKTVNDKIAEAEADAFKSLKDVATKVRNGADEALKQLEDVNNLDDALAKAKKVAEEAADYAKKSAEEKIKQTEAAKALEDLKNKAAEVKDATFKKIQDAAKTVKDGIDEAQKTYDDQNFDEVKKKATEIAQKTEETAKELAKLIEKQREWEQKRPDLSQVEEEVAQLVEWGIDEAKDVKKKAEDAAKKAADEAYDEAVNTVEDAKKAIAPLIEKLDKEKRAEVIYKGLKAAYDAQMDAIKQGRYAAEQGVKLILDQVHKATAPIENLVTEKEFEKAAEEIKKAAEELAKAAKEATRLENVEKQARDAIKTVNDKINEAERTGIQSVKDALTTVRNAAAAVEKQLEDVKSVDDALAKAQKLVADAADQAKKAAAKELEKVGWEKKQQDIEAVKKQIDELRSMGSREAKELLETVKKAANHAVEEKWAEATSKVDEMKTKAKTALDDAKKKAHKAADEMEEEIQQAFGGLDKEFDDLMKGLKGS